MPLIDLRGIDAAFNRYNEKRYEAVRRTCTVINFAQVSHECAQILHIHVRLTRDFSGNCIAYEAWRNVTYNIGASQ